MNTLDTVGNTPLYELSSLYGGEKDIKIYGKGEFMNPGGSVKDRSAKSMILNGLETGSLTKDRIITDATSGNTGIAYAMIGAVLGYRVRLVVPGNVTEERKLIMRAYGADLIETDPLEGIDGAYEFCNAMVSKAPDKYFYPDQYCNESNWKAHYSGTGAEILEQTGGRLTHFVAGTGTSGTFTGCSRLFADKKPDVKSYTVTPDTPFHGIEGIKFHAAMLKKGFFDESAASGRIEVSTDEAYRMANSLAKELGLFVGVSSGANVTAALKLAETDEVADGSVIVTILCDGGYRYLSSRIWDERES